MTISILDVTAPAKAISNQADAILDGYLDACRNRDAYHRNLAARNATRKTKRSLVADMLANIIPGF